MAIAVYLPAARFQKQVFKKYLQIAEGKYNERYKRNFIILTL